MLKKAQGLSVTTIVVAVIALIVIVILISLFTGKFGAFGAGLKSIGDPTKICEGTTGQGGHIRDACLGNEDSIVSSDATAKGKKCCKSTPTTPGSGSLGNLGNACGGVSGATCKSGCITSLSVPAGDSSCSPLKCCL
jgi:hypothetical protein